ncbi:MAG TPA: serine/threonine-protein kinase, partial [Gemmatimonadaceae bacterium]|nr:serine/threonine-protein kinase [Gemmatimonadaceae bacterium]
VDTEGWAIVTDFGIAKAGQAAGLTMTGTAIGTPYYMSPEQCAAKKELTGASDQYSLGVVAYEMLTGRVPFNADSPLAIMFAHSQDAPPPITQALPDCPPDVAIAIDRMLAKDPADRFPDVESAVAAIGAAPLARDDPAMVRLRALARDGASAARAKTAMTPVSPIPGALKSRAAPVPTTPLAPPPAAPPSRRSPRFAMVGLLLVAALGGTWWFTRGETPVPAPPPAPPSAAKVDTVIEKVHDTVAVAPPPAPAPAPPAAPPTSPPVRPSAIVPAAAPKPSPAPRPVAPPPAPPPAPPAAPPRDVARDEIASVVSDYATALESRNLTHVRAVYPGMTPSQAQELGTFLAQAKDLHASLRITEFTHSGDHAEATLETTYEYFDLKAGHEDRRTVTQHATFSASSGNWKISSVE